MRNDPIRELKPANQNPWYLLATLHGEFEETAVHFDWPDEKALGEKNKTSWNRYFSMPLLASQPDDQATKQILELYRKRAQDCTATPPDPLNGINFSNCQFDRPVYFKDFVFSVDIDFRNSIFVRSVAFENARFEKKAFFIDTQFGLYFKTEPFAPGVSDYICYANFKGAQFKEYVSLMEFLIQQIFPMLISAKVSCFSAILDHIINGFHLMAHSLNMLSLMA